MRAPAFPAVLALLLAGCGPANDASAPAAKTSPDARRPAEQADLFGQWRVVGLGGTALPKTPPIHVLIGHDRIEATSQCVPFKFAMAVEKGRAAVADLPNGWPVCARNLSPAEEAFGALMQATTRVEHRPGERIAFIAPRGEVVMERERATVVNPFGHSSVDPFLMWGAWHVAAIDGEPVPTEAPMSMLFAGWRAEARSGCAAMTWQLSPIDGTLLLTPQNWPLDRCRRAPSPAENRLRQVLAGRVRIARASATERLLVRGDGSVLLRR